MQKLYQELATWWPLLSPVEDYAEEADFFWQVLADQGLGKKASLLELGCGGGNNAFYLNQHFLHVTLTDISPSMLGISKTLNPECEHLLGDMRELRLERCFDVVFIHDAIDYMTSHADLQRALETAFVHCKPGGLGLFVPDHLRETFQACTEHEGNSDQDKGIRLLSWSHAPNPGDTHYQVDYAYLLRENNHTWVEHEQSVYGLFAKEDWRQLLVKIGFEVEIFEDNYGREIFCCKKKRPLSYL